jgi:ElaB/YqjD/DUF883 family membrane-anchored ribosome-binding protein
MSTSEQLEREAEQTRAEIASMLDELRSRMTPGQIVDQIVDFARDSTGGQFFQNLRRQVAENPVPLTLVGAGLAWFMLAGRNGSRRVLSESRYGVESDFATEESGDYYGTTGRYEPVGERPSTGGITTRAKEAASGVAERAKEAGARVSDMTSSVADAAGSATESVVSAASAAYEASTERARRAADFLSSSGSTLRHGSVEAGRNFARFVQEQPLVIAGAGLAIGAALGAMFPSTRAEDELMGEASDAVKRRAKDTAAAQIEKGKNIAGRVWEEAKQEAGKLGVPLGTVGSDEGQTTGENMYRVSADEVSTADIPEGIDQPAGPDGSRENAETPRSRDAF